MSRIGKLPIPLPKGVEARMAEGELTVKGPQGEQSAEFDERYIELEIGDGQLVVKRRSEERKARELHGLYRSLFNNMVQGVFKKYERNLEINGVGYRAELKGKQLSLIVGFAGPKDLDVPDGVDVKIDKGTKIALASIDKQKVGQFAAEIRRVRPPEPYKSKGIKYEEEVIRKKAGKTAS